MTTDRLLVDILGVVCLVACMAFQSVETIVGVDSTSLPFVNEYVEQHPESNGMIALVTQIVEVKSGKGYLLKTPSFACFCWKKDKVIAYILERIGDSGEMNQPMAIACKIDLTSKNGFRLLLDEDEGQIWDKNGDTYEPAYDGKVFHKDDPSIPPSPPPAINPPSKGRRRN